MMDIKKEDIRQEVFDLYDDYAHNRLSRRDFVHKLSFYSIGSLTVPAILSFLMPDYKSTIQVQADDPRLDIQTVSYDSPRGGKKINAQIAMPKGNTQQLGTVVVVHENRGLNPHIADIGRRIALAGFLSIAPDALTPLGGYPGTDDEGRALQSKRDKNDMLEDFIQAAAYIKNSPYSNGKVGVVGFCFGGWIANMMAARISNLSAAVPFYGAHPPLEEVPNIQSPLLIHYAELDKHITESWPGYEAALKAAGKHYQAYIYEGANHGFNNDTTPRYDKKAATLAWDRTTQFFKEKLQS